MDYRKTGISLGLIAAVVGLGYWQAHKPTLMPDDFATRIANLRNEGKSDEILRVCSEIIEREPNHWEARISRGWELHALSRYAQAIDDLNVALEGQPNHRDADKVFYKRARCFEKLGRYDEAIEDFDESIKRNTHYMWAFYWRGRAHESLDHHAEALADYKVVIETEPNEPEIRLRMARLEIELGQYEEAEATLRIAKANAGNNASVIGRADVLNDERLKRMVNAAPAESAQAAESSAR